MEDEISQQSQEPAEVTQEAHVEAPQETPSETPEITLEDVAKKYNVEEQVKQFTATPEPSPQAQPQYQQPPQQQPQYNGAPDPLVDLEGFNRHYAQQSTEVHAALLNLNNAITEMRKEKEYEALRADVNTAVARVNERLKVDPKYAEILLEKYYRDEPKFRTIWDNRRTNPKALNEALDVITNQAAKVFQVRVDPQLVENTRAAKASQRAAPTSNQNGMTDVLKMDDGAFDQWWEKAKRGEI